MMRFYFLGIQFSRCMYDSDVSIFVSGDEGNRTPDPLLARQVLSQLSYAPIWVLKTQWA